MDGGSSLNLIYAYMLQKTKIPMNDLLPIETSFHGIVPGKPTYPLGVIHLDVIFGTPTNLRKQKIKFEVVDWPSQYHAILGRPAFAQFKAVPHYAYLKLQMPANRGPVKISEVSPAPRIATRISTPCPRHSGFMNSSTNLGRTLTWI
jgi:hypothetical protein